jgi:signal transduction histidine kinase
METLRVLITDDEPGMRLGVRRVLRDLRIEIADIAATAVLEIEEADCGETALEMIAHQPPDILILDHKMPGISGLDVLDQIKDSDGDLLTIMITAYASIETAVRAVKRGAYDFLAKPFTPDELRNTVHKAAVRIILAKQARRLAEERSQVRLQFMRTLSHELQAPLGAVTGYLDMLQNRLHGDSLAEYDPLLRRSQDRLTEMRRLIEDLLAMTTVESRSRQRQLTTLDVQAAVREAMETLSSVAAAQNVDVKLHGDAAITMTADPVELGMIAQNLISNAIKYNRPGGQVHVTVDRNGQTVTISVADTGCGIAEDQLDRLCDEFVRVKTDATRDVSGSGLGLSIVDKVARLYEGEIVINSELGVGSTFTVVLHDVPPAESRTVHNSGITAEQGPLPTDSASSSCPAV